MSIVPRVGRKSRPVASFIFTCYVLLTLGSLCMIIPFLIMLTASVSNDWDYESYRLWPRYIFDRQERYLKFLTEKYTGYHAAGVNITRDFRLFSSAHPTDPAWASFHDIRKAHARHDAATPFLISNDSGPAANQSAMHRDYLDWMDSFDEPLMTLPMFPRYIRSRYQEYLKDRYTSASLERRQAGQSNRSSGDLEQMALQLMAEAWQEARFERFHEIEMLPEGAYPYHLRSWMPPRHEGRIADYEKFVQSLPGDWKVPVTAQHLWLRFLESEAGDLNHFRRRTGLSIRSYAELLLPVSTPENAVLRELWDTFMREKWPLWMVRLPPARKADYLEYLRARAGTLGRFNAMVRQDYSTWEEIPFSGRSPLNGYERNLWRDYLRQLPLNEITRYRFYPELSYREFLKERYRSIDAVNRAHGLSATSFEVLQVPLADVDRVQFRENERQWLRNFLSFNYRRVLAYMAVQDRAVFNTFILVLLTVVSSLTVNPLAAYALSRFRLKSSSKILLFLLATMAFPAEVSMIPNFLLLRDLGLLNSFAALVLPGLANGFGIFLLKGFFDSLPDDLYEAATLDGAREITIFARITLPLSTPILAYQALLSFIGAYGGFMWAFLVCQDSRMWTLMVWIFQFQQTASSLPYMVIAAFVLASIPTLIVFLFCQKIILRGIVVPTMD